MVGFLWGLQAAYLDGATFLWLSIAVFAAWAR